MFHSFSYLVQVPSSYVAGINKKRGSIQLILHIFCILQTLLWMETKDCKKTTNNPFLGTCAGERHWLTGDSSVRHFSEASSAEQGVSPDPETTGERGGEFFLLINVVAAEWSSSTRQVSASEVCKWSAPQLLITCYVKCGKARIHLNWRVKQQKLPYWRNTKAKSWINQSLKELQKPSKHLRDLTFDPSLLHYPLLTQAFSIFRCFFASSVGILCDWMVHCLDKA